MHQCMLNYYTTYYYVYLGKIKAATNLENQVIPLGDDVTKGTAISTLTERNAAVHAPRCLYL